MTLAVLFALLLSAQPSVTGRWQTTDDKTHRPRGIVRLYEENGAIFGKVEKSLDPKEEGAICIKCTDERKNQPIAGLLFVRNMKPQANGEFTDGDILDPETGSVYRCKMKIEDGGKKLIVRGFIGFSLLGRSQTWLRLE